MRDKEKMFENMNIELFYGSLEKENKIKVCSYMLDKIYGYEENEELDESNGDIINLLNSDKEILNIVMKIVTDSIDDVVLYKDDEIKKLVSDFKNKN